MVYGCAYGGGDQCCTAVLLPAFERSGSGTIPATGSTPDEVVVVGVGRGKEGLPYLMRRLSLSCFSSTKNLSLSALLGYVAALPDVEGMTYTGWGGGAF